MGSSSLDSVDEVVQEIMRIRRSLPARPTVEELEAAVDLVRNVEKEEQACLEAISRQRKATEVPDELFFVLQEMQRSLAVHRCKEQKRGALRLLELDAVYVSLDEMVQRASLCLSSSSNGSFSPASAGSSSIATTSSRSFPDAGNPSALPGFLLDKSTRSVSDRFAKDDSFLKPSRVTRDTGAFAGRNAPPTGLTIREFVPSADAEKLTLIKLASLIEVSSKRGARELGLRNRLLDQIEWLPDSIGKLSGLLALDLSENRIVALPATIGGLSSLSKLDLRCNRIVELPSSIGELLSLEYLYLSANQLSVLPPTLGKLRRLLELELNSNRLTCLPDAVGNLLSLRKLIVETNDIEELPHTIGNCASLVELRTDYNRLKGLPEAVGRLSSLQILSVRYNNIKNLPTTMASLSCLREIDVSFNELEAVPESLCLATTLVRMNIGSNFADLQALPRSIGNLEMLEELDISNNQIRVLPNSFGMLSQLRVLRAEENPLEIPPRNVAELGAEAVVKYMADLVAGQDGKQQSAKSKNPWTQFCFFSRPNKRKHVALSL